MARAAPGVIKFADRSVCMQLLYLHIIELQHVYTLNLNTVSDNASGIAKTG